MNHNCSQHTFIDGSDFVPDVLFQLPPSVGCLFAYSVKCLQRKVDGYREVWRLVSQIIKWCGKKIWLLNNNLFTYWNQNSTLMSSVTTSNVSIIAYYGTEFMVTMQSLVQYVSVRETTYMMQFLKSKVYIWNGVFPPILCNLCISYIQTNLLKQGS